MVVAEEGNGPLASSLSLLDRFWLDLYRGETSGGRSALEDVELDGVTVLEPQVFADLVGYIERGEVRPVAARTSQLEQVHETQPASSRRTTSSRW